MVRKIADIRKYPGDPYTAWMINGQPWPHTLRIGAETIRISFTARPGTGSGEANPDNLDEHNWGYITYWDHRIDINSCTAPEKWFGVLMHEVVHVIDDDRGLKPKKQTINQMARGLVDFLLDNGWLVVERVESLSP